MKGFLPLLLAVLLSLRLGGTLPLSEVQGLIQGRVANGTADGGSTAGLEVALLVWQGKTPKPTLTAMTDAQGDFQFQGLETGGEWTYLLRVSYEGVIYSHGPFSFEAGKGVYEAWLDVYETTTDEAGIVVERAHLLLEFADASLRVAELYIFFNPGDRTYIGQEEVEGRRATWSFLLPRGASDLVLDDGALGGRFLAIQGGFVDTEPQWPGRTSVMFRYRLDCAARDCALTKEITAPTANLNVLLPDTGMRLESERLSFAGRIEAQGGSYLNYVGRNIAAGEKLTLRLMQPAPENAEMVARSAKGRPATVAIMVLMGIGAALALGYPLWKAYAKGTVSLDSGEQENRSQD